MDLKKLRKELHAFPELSFEELNTRSKLKKLIQTFHPSEITDIGKTGFYVVFNSKKPGRTVLIRCELDALPITEINTFEYTSQNQGIAHLCGHDGHMAILVGVAEQLSFSPPDSGKVILIFQPAEEIGAGAKNILDDPLFSAIKPDVCFSLHNVPGFEKGSILCKTGTFTPSVISIIIELEGKTAHAAQPETGINPSSSIAEIIQFGQGLTNYENTAENFCIVTPIYTSIGSKAYGTSAGNGETHFTIRTLSNLKTQATIKQLQSFCQKIAVKDRLKLSISYTEEFKANENDADAVFQIEKAAKKLGYQYQELNQPFPWGEDFGLFTTRYPGAMFGLGAGKSTPDLHNPDYDFPDELINYGVNMFKQLIKQTIATCV